MQQCHSHDMQSSAHKCNNMGSVDIDTTVSLHACDRIAPLGIQAQRLKTWSNPFLNMAPLPSVPSGPQALPSTSRHTPASPAHQGQYMRSGGNWRGFSVSEPLPKKPALRNKEWDEWPFRSSRACMHVCVHVCESVFRSGGRLAD